MRFPHVVLAIIGLLFSFHAHAATTLLPPGMQCFTDANGPIISGSINMFYPSTTSVKPTWLDPNQSALNTQPIQLDSNGCATIYGIGSYRQQVYDGPVVGGLTSGNLIFDKLTTDTSAYNSTFWGGLAGGTPNAITLIDPGFNATDGTVINFTALSTNSAATTINPSGFGPVTVVKNTSLGPVSLTGGEIVSGNQISVIYSLNTNSFVLLNTVIASASSTATPLCGASGLKILNDLSLPNTKVDVIASQVVTQAPGGAFINRSGINLAMTINVIGANGLDTGSATASTWYYVYIIDNGTAPATLASLSSTGPTMPSGFTYKCLVGAFPTNVGNNITPFVQTGNVFSYQVSVAPLPVIASGVAGTWSATTPVTAPATIAGNGFCAPGNATSILINATNIYQNGTAANVLAAPNAAWAAIGGPRAAVGMSWPLSLFSATPANVQAQMKLEATTIYWASDAAGGALTCQGFTMSVNAY